MVSEESVLQLYHLVLCRAPESDDIVRGQMQQDSIHALLWQCVRSDEFLTRYRSAMRRVFDA